MGIPNAAGSVTPPKKNGGVERNTKELDDIGGSRTCYCRTRIAVVVAIKDE